MKIDLARFLRTPAGQALAAAAVPWLLKQAGKVVAKKPKPRV